MASVSEIVRKRQRELGISDDLGDLQRPLSDRNRSRVDQYRENLHSMVENLPRGALGGSGYYAGDRSTWDKAPPPEKPGDNDLRRFAEEFLFDPAEAPDRLDSRERAMLHEAADKEADATTQEHFEYNDQLQANYRNVSNKLYADMKLSWPEDARNPELGAAIQALIQNSGMTTEELIYVSNNHPFDVLQRIHETLEEGQFAKGDDFGGNYDDNDNRTMGTSGGGGDINNRRDAQNKADEAKLSSMSSIINEFQKKHGFTR